MAMRMKEDCKFVQETLGRISELLKDYKKLKLVTDDPQCTIQRRIICNQP